MSDERLIQWLASVSADPLTYVLGAFPWGQGRLKGFDGPELWQRQILEAIRDGLLDLSQAIQLATASGHGVGKSALVAWIIKWATDTKADTRGVVTANTETQLKTKTWAELGKWHHMSVTREVFKLTATAYFHPDHERTWRIDMVPWSERNTEAFAGLHNKGRRILVIFDEASAIPEVIWETTEGALTDSDTQIIWCVFGNPTRNTGRFKDCFPGGRFARFWSTIQVDSRRVSITNKDQIAKWIEVYGEDSDFSRSRIRGMFPHIGEMEFFSAQAIREAMEREPIVHMHDPLALGVDVARFGSNCSVLFPRKGRDAQSIPRTVYKGMDTVALTDQVFALSERLRADGIFIDGGGVGGGVVDQCRNRNLFVYDVQFGGKPSGVGYAYAVGGERYANKRAEMYGALRGWLRTGSLPNDPELEKQLLSITYTYNLRDEILLTSKEQMMRDGKPSPDDVDALALTFAHILSIHDHAGGDYPAKPLIESEYDPFSPERMAA